VATARAALYLRVSTGRHAESDLSIPDQRRQIEGYCMSRGWEVGAEFVEPGNTATDVVTGRGGACRACFAWQLSWLVSSRMHQVRPQQLSRIRMHTRSAARP
jgi:hypothetical protein